MEYIADLHIHSHYSRATSRESNLLGLAAWARLKGIQLLGSGDFTHPLWFKALREQLIPAEPGLFRLKNENLPSPFPHLRLKPEPVRFLLSAEVSSIYKKDGRVRKVHSLIFVPDFAAAERINNRLAAIGNISSDGRPILGLDARHLLEIVLELAPGGFLVPAHIWTPWFSLFGSKSGFNSIEECFGDLAPHIFALETGLSSDPAMNRLVSNLDRFALISNSDCHSPSNLGREANIFNTGFDFHSLRDALRANRSPAFSGTVEFFPEQGKYHYDGHRSCHICLDPTESKRRGYHCPECGKPVTVGVQHRVLELADREEPHYPAGAPGFQSLIPLTDILCELRGVQSASKPIHALYGDLIGLFHSEFALLMKASLEDIISFSPLLAEAIGRMRSGKVIRRSGFDGEYGRISLFAENEILRLFADDPLLKRGRGGRCYSD